ncbi:MAG TPA: alkene reductase [Cyanobacteria bacterium UBA9273]|nr:alkene reductase [Cyanobacteria bacterium UBA9273]
MSTDINLLETFQIGRYTLPNRMVMAPLTRNRAGAGNVPTDLNATYYAQRASAGLIITEASQISAQGMGYPNTPGIYSPQQIEGWQLVTKAVHDRKGHIFLQLWHVGRISHPDLQPEGALPLAPSAIAPEGMASTYSGEKPFVTPRALATEEIPLIVEQYRKGAENALAAGFDGVEIHSANGYLLDQFLQDGANQRCDRYGGSIENRARLLMEVTEAVVSVWGADRVGVRLSPSGTFNSMSDSNPVATFSYVAEALNRFGLAYLHLVEPRINPDALNRWAKGNNTSNTPQPDLTARYFRSLFHGTLISAGGYDRALGNATLAAGDADLIAYGRLFISNPDLPQRFALNAPLNPYDRSTFYGGDEKGYTDYPTLQWQTA